MKILTVTLNPTFDFHINIDNFRPGEENYAADKQRQIGGKGINTSRALTVNGIENTAFILTPEGGRDEFLKHLENDKINAVLCYTEGKGSIRENLTIHSDKYKETRISFEGVGICDNDVNNLFHRVGQVCDGDTSVVFSGRIPKGIDKIQLIENLLQIKKTGALIYLDSNSLTFNDICEIKPFLVKPNEYELASLCGHENLSNDYISDAKKLIEAGVKRVLLSLGEKGAFLISGNNVISAKAPVIAPLSTIGAGDSLLAGFLALKSKNGNDKEALKNAVAWGSAKCQREGTLPPLPEDIALLYDKIILR